MSQRTTGRFVTCTIALAAALLAGAALYICYNEGTENWQAVWTCAMYLLLAITLWRARAAQIPK